MFFRRPFDYCARFATEYRSLLLTLIPPSEQVAQDGSRYGVPDAGDGGGDGGFGVTREEFGAQTRGETGVLYADFDSDGTFLAVFIPVSAPL